MSELDNLEPKPASDINPKPEKMAETLSSVYKNIEMIYRDSTVDTHAAGTFISGYDKNTQPDITILNFLKSFNILVYDYILKSNRPESDQARQIKIVFESINSLYDIIENIDDNISKEFISHITGYNFKLLKKVYNIK